VTRYDVRSRSYFRRPEEGAHPKREASCRLADLVPNARGGIDNMSDSPGVDDGMPPLVTLSEWYAQGLPLLDVRATEAPRMLPSLLQPPTEHAQQTQAQQQQQQLPPVRPHFPVVVRIPLEELGARSFELPPRHKPFFLLVSADDWHTDDRLAPLLMGLTTTTTTTTEQPLPTRPLRKRPRRTGVPWKVAGVIVDTAANFRQALELGLVPACTETAPVGISSSYVPLPRLWAPDSMVEEILLPLLCEATLPMIKVGEAITTDDHATTKRTLVRRLVWDWGAGSGRDAAFLAEELRWHSGATASWHVTACDQRYHKGGTSAEEPCALFFARRGLVECTSCRQADLHTAAVVEELLRQASSSPAAEDPPSVLASIYMVRFYKPALVKALAASPLVPAGMLLAISHFAVTEPDGEWTFTHPKVRAALRWQDSSMRRCSRHTSHISGCPPCVA
jgi:hypothetical protein